MCYLKCFQTFCKKKELLKSGNDSEKPYKLVIGVCTVQVTISYIL